MISTAPSSYLTLILHKFDGTIVQDTVNLLSYSLPLRLHLPARTFKPLRKPAHFGLEKSLQIPWDTVQDEASRYRFPRWTIVSTIYCQRPCNGRLVLPERSFRVRSALPSRYYPVIFIAPQDEKRGKFWTFSILPASQKCAPKS